MKSRFAKTWLVILVMVLAILGVRFLFFSQATPTMKEVLTQSQWSNSFDFSLFVVTLLALSLATLSVAKGYEIFKRSQSVTDVVLPEVLDLDRGEVEELKQENNELVRRLEKGEAQVAESKRLESMLRKSNIALGKECERLKSQNEELLLKINSLKIKPRKRRKKK